tara:strand:+ start:387 stop:893 length:507 start_codon:yes stop_codon:yes gene_type:complete
MTDTTIQQLRTVQDIFDDERKNKSRIKELEEEIESISDLKVQLKECKKKIKILEKERKTLKIDLLKEKKLEWIECDLTEWRKYFEENDDDPVIYYIYRYDGGIRQQGYYKGEFKLNEKDTEHFKEYFDDYFYYGYPNYQDANHPYADGSECYLAFGGGAACVTSFEWD